MAEVFKDAEKYHPDKWWEMLPLSIGQAPGCSDIMTVMMAFVTTYPTITGTTVLKKTWNTYFKIHTDKLMEEVFETLEKYHQKPHLVKKFDSEYYDDLSTYGHWYYFKTGAIMFRPNKNGDGQASFTLITHNAPLYDDVTKIVEKHQDKLPPAGTIHMMCSTPDGPEFVSVGIGGLPLERGNYTEHELKLFDRIKEDLGAKQPKGRLHILAGDPGSGKTYAIRGLLAETRNVAFVVVPVDSVASLANPSSLTALTSLREDQGNKPIVLIIEDADNCLVNREDGDLSAISAVLNMGDGLMGAVLDIRIVATTNANIRNLDKAITRPGRLSTEITFDALPALKANEVFKRLTGKEGPFTQPTILAEVYTKAGDAGWTPPAIPVKKKVGFGQ